MLHMPSKVYLYLSQGYSVSLPPLPSTLMSNREYVENEVVQMVLNICNNHWLSVKDEIGAGIFSYTHSQQLCCQYKSLFFDFHTFN